MRAAENLRRASATNALFLSPERAFLLRSECAKAILRRPIVGSSSSSQHSVSYLNRLRYPLTSDMRTWATVCLFALVMLIAAWLRLEQLRYQILDGDEWHAVHQLTYYPMSKVMLTYGFADYGIPVVLYYKLLSLMGGVSELRMRFPMLLCGLLTVALLPWFFRHHFSRRVLWLFALLLALSPMLIDYSRMARTYAITLLGSYAAFYCLVHAVRGEELHRRWGAAYAALCGLIIWSHAITGPLLIAPLVVMWIERTVASTPIARWLRCELPLRWSGLIRLTCWTGLAMSLAVLPPLMGDPGAIANKSGMDQPNLETWWGLLHFWAGSGSETAVLIGSALALFGAPALLRAGPMVRWLLWGIALTAIAIVVSKPWWSHVSLALARYLLPALPLFHLAVAAGAVALFDRFVPATAPAAMRAALQVSLLIAYLVLWSPTTPIPDWLNRPNSYTHHYYFAGEYRRDQNVLRLKLPEVPNSPYWKQLSSLPPGSAVIAVAPTYWSTFAPFGPVWEAWSRQRVIPAFLWGSCEQTRHGEVPPNSHFKLRNGVHLNSIAEMERRSVTHVAYYLAHDRAELLPRLPHCEAWVRQHFGTPDYEDAHLMLWNFSTLKTRVQTR
ncbi:MAG: glycosyltransferase family 39 protein [Burkholderiales bacterium]|nr:glycosyltransferase family 39 protein [Burkholderiales bacterium]